jgi:hypothetical protein
MAKPHGYGMTEKETFIAAEAVQESGGNYGAVNSSSSALGKWQIMPGNLPGWARQCGMRVLTPTQFLHDHSYQDAMVWCVLGGYFDKYGPRGAASMWYSGQPDWHAPYGNPPVYQYVDDIIRIMGDPNIPPYSPSDSTGVIVLPTPPLPGQANDWSGHVRRSAAQFTNIAHLFHRYANGIERITRWVG